MRRNFSSSGLVRLLGEWGHVDGAASGADFAERLSPWLGPFHATTLHAAHQSIKTLAAGPQTPQAQHTTATTLADEVQRVHAALVKGFTESPVTPTYGKRADQRWGQPAVVEAVAEAEAEYAPHHRRYLDQQRQMELKIEALRGHVRQVMSRVSTPLKQLAALDATMEHMLVAREQKLLATVPAFLERRFEQLRQAHQQTLADAGAEDNPALWRQPNGWLAIFGRDLQALLLAELNVRIEPVTGLMEALSNDVNKHE